MSTTKQTITGTVVAKNSALTIRVSTKVTRVHPLYQKRYSLTRTYTAHNPGDAANLGDVVTIESCRPMSKTKRWIVRA
jgi:small subunit ribosomal protein S17